MRWAFSSLVPAGAPGQGFLGAARRRLPVRRLETAHCAPQVGAYARIWALIARLTPTTSGTSIGRRYRRLRDDAPVARFANRAKNPQDRAGPAAGERKGAAGNGRVSGTGPRRSARAPLRGRRRAARPGERVLRHADRPRDLLPAGRPVPGRRPSARVARPAARVPEPPVLPARDPARPADHLAGGGLDLGRLDDLPGAGAGRLAARGLPAGAPRLVPRGKRVRPGRLPGGGAREPCRGGGVCRLRPRAGGGLRDGGVGLVGLRGPAVPRAGAGPARLRRAGTVRGPAPVGPGGAPVRARGGARPGVDVRRASRPRARVTRPASTSPSSRCFSPR